MKASGGTESSMGRAFIITQRADARKESGMKESECAGSLKRPIIDEQLTRFIFPLIIQNIKN